MVPMWQIAVISLNYTLATEQTVWIVNIFADCRYMSYKTSKFSSALGRKHHKFIDKHTETVCEETPALFYNIILALRRDVV